MLPLRGGHWTNRTNLDRIRHVDLRSLNYLARDLLTGEQQREPRSYTWSVDVWLDQGVEGACVGAGWAHELAARPGLVTGITMAWARERVYWEAQRIDEWPGGSYEGARPYYDGTSVLAGAKVVHAMGLIAEYRWALDVIELANAVSYTGPAVIGVDWYEGMLDTDQDGFIHPAGRWMGGHCLVALGVRVVRDAAGGVDWLASNFVLHNSWGRSWGANGRARISFVEMALLVPGGDFCVPIGRAAARVGP